MEARAGDELASGRAGPQSRWLRFIKFYLNFCIKLNQNNPAGGEPDGFGPSTERAKLPWWSHLAQVFFVYFTLKLLACLTLQHNHNRLARKLGTAPSGAGQPNQNDDESELTVSWMRWLGNAYYEFGFAVEPACVFTLYMAYMGYVKPLIHTIRRGPAVFRLVRMILDPGRERELFIKADVERQVRTWLESSENRVQATGRGQLALANSAHARNVSDARQLAAGGQLVPLNRTFQWAELRAAEIYARLTVFFVFGSWAVACALLLVFPHAGLIAAKLHNEPRDLLFQAELLAYCMWGVLAINFQLMLILVDTLDQIEFVARLRQLVAGLVEDASLILQDAQRVEEADRGEANRRLMRALIQYKLLKGQMRSTRAVVGTMFGVLIVTMLLAPALVRLQVAHLSAQMRYLYLGCCLFIIISCDVLILPACWLCARSLDLFRSMSCLLAHVEAARHHESAGHDESARPKAAHKKIYDEHTVALLRREQGSPDMAERLFATDAYFVRLNYPKFLGIHFYCGVLLAPMLLRDTSSLASGSLFYLF